MKVNQTLDKIQSDILLAIEQLGYPALDRSSLVVTPCKKEFSKDFTLVTFGLAKTLRINPETLASSLGSLLISNRVIGSFEVVKGFLNFSMSDAFWVECMHLLKKSSPTGQVSSDESLRYLIEYCSPNTNKPLHLGHVRNILLGWSVTQILKAAGHEVSTTQVINDRGIAICKSMLAWKKFAHGDTPQTSGIKPDHFVGDYYVLFEQKFRDEYSEWQQSDSAEESFSRLKKDNESKVDFFKRFKNEYFTKFSKLGNEASEMLRNWEAGDSATLDLWKQMNHWVYDGFKQTQDLLGVSFDSTYYESKTYLLGKDIVQKGLNDGVFHRSEDGAVFIDLTDAGLDKKILLRSDGTSIYITQDIGTAMQRHEIHHADKYVYVVADEQDYHFQTLFEILKRLNVPFAEGLYHLSYGMVELPSGRMKSREGTVVDADDLIKEVYSEAQKSASERGELESLSESERERVIFQIALSALKYYLLKVHPKKRMIFDPTESVDLQGHTGPYILNAYVRIQSVLRKADTNEFKVPAEIVQAERELLNSLLQYPKVIQESARQLDPSHLANYLYQMAKDFHRYYHDYRILNAETEELKSWRLSLIDQFGQYLKHGMNCLGIQMPDRM